MYSLITLLEQIWSSEYIKSIVPCWSMSGRVSGFLSVVYCRPPPRRVPAPPQITCRMTGDIYSRSRTAVISAPGPDNNII